MEHIQFEDLHESSTKGGWRKRIVASECMLLQYQILWFLRDWSVQRDRNPTSITASCHTLMRLWRGIRREHPC